MSDPARRRALLRYSVTAVLLLVLVAWLAILQRNWDRAARAIASGVVVKDLTGEIRRIDSTVEEGAMDHWLLTTQFGGLRLAAPSTTGGAPLHIHRVNHEAILTVSGKLATTHVTAREGTASRQTLVPNATTLVSYAPYTAHGWAKLAGSGAAVALVFSSAPYEASPTQVRDDDDRIALGSSPDVFDAEPLLAQLRQSGLPSIHHQLPALEGRIAVVAVSSEIAIEPRSGPSAFWVLSGRGRTLGPVDQALAANHLAVVLAQTPLRIAAQPGAPLLLIDYQPDRLDVTSILRKEKKLYSQWNEELLIRDFFRDRRDGTFLDVGSADYKRLSTTYYLEERLGWSGLAVDGLAEYAAGYAEHRPRTRFFNYLVGDASSGPGKFYRVPRFVELSSASRPAAGYLERMVPGGGGSKAEEFDVPTITLNDLLRQQGVDRIDFLSMDIEGHEPEALAGFDIQRWHPRLVCIETQEALADRIYKYFRGHGYARIERYLPFDPRNWYFAPETQEPSGAR